MDERLIKLFTINNGYLEYDQKRVGKDALTPGFERLEFKEQLSHGANGITFRVIHKILKVEQVVKIYVPDIEGENQRRAIAEAKKNAKTDLNGLIAVVFDAGEYQYPVKIGFSVMESINGFLTLKELRRELKNENSTNYSLLPKESFDIYASVWRKYLYNILNIAAGFLRTVIFMYKKGYTHGDLNPGNVLWLLNGKSLKEYFSKEHLGNIDTYDIKLIDLGSSEYNDYNRRIGKLRDCWFIYDQIRSLLSPLFSNSNTRFADWLNVTPKKDSPLKDKLGRSVEHLIMEDQKDCEPDMIACDMFRLISVMNLSIGLINNNRIIKKAGIKLRSLDKRDFVMLMFSDEISYIDTMSYSENEVMTTNCFHKSTGSLINWDIFWSTKPFSSIDTSYMKKSNY